MSRLNFSCNFFNTFHFEFFSSFVWLQHARTLLQKSPHIIHSSFIGHCAFYWTAGAQDAVSTQRVPRGKRKPIHCRRKKKQETWEIVGLSRHLPSSFPASPHIPLCPLSALSPINPTSHVSVVPIYSFPPIFSISDLTRTLLHLLPPLHSPSGTCFSRARTGARPTNRLEAWAAHGEADLKRDKKNAHEE